MYSFCDRCKCQVLLSYVGEDATDAVRAFHRDNASLQKFLTPLVVARVCTQPELATGAKGMNDAAVAPLHDPSLENDFRQAVIFLDFNHLGPKVIDIPSSFGRHQQSAQKALPASQPPHTAPIDDQSQPQHSGHASAHTTGPATLRAPRSPLPATPRAHLAAPPAPNHPLLLGPLLQGWRLPVRAMLLAH
jgi:hypothetical protein